MRIIAILEGDFITYPCIYRYAVKIFFFLSEHFAVHRTITWSFISTFRIQYVECRDRKQWKFSKTTWIVLIACIIPFGTFYIDRKILNKI
ncbi:DUF3817 domain-containing protein [Paenimyroides ceti]